MFDQGQTVVLREVLHGRIRSARPLRVVVDDADGFVGYLTPRSQVAWPRLIDTEQSQTPDQGWRLVDEVWQGPGSLFVIPSGEAFAAVLFFDSVTAEPLSWKVDFMRPLRRTATGFDTLDTALDLLAPLDRSTWTVKDTDDFAQLGRIGMLAEDEVAQVEAARARAEALITDKAGPFDDRWVTWRPDRSWPPLSFPPEWDLAGTPTDDPLAPSATALVVERHRHSLDSSSETTFGKSGGGPVIVRSALGSEVLDAEGTVWHDFDLAGGTLLLGHNHPAVVEAVSRQLSLLHRPPSGTLHETEIAVAEHLLERVGRGDRVHFTRSGEAAKRLAASLGVGSHDARIDLDTGTDEPLVIFGEEHASGWPFGAIVGPASLIDQLDSRPGEPADRPDALVLTAALETLRLLTTERLARLRNRTRTWADDLTSAGEIVGFRVKYAGGASLAIEPEGAELPLSEALRSRTIMHGGDLLLTLAETTSESALSRATNALRSR